MTDRLAHARSVPDPDEVMAIVLCSPPIVPSDMLTVNVHDRLKQAYGNYIVSTTSFPELTLPIETSVSGSQFSDFAGLTNIVVVANIGPAATPPIRLNRVVNSGIYRIPAPQLMPGALYGILHYGDKVARKICILRDRLKQFQIFSQGWDAASGEAFTAATITNADKVIDLILRECLVRSMVPNVLLGPVSDGSLRFEWKNDNKELFITVLGESVTLQQWQPLDAVESQGYWDTTLEGIHPQIGWLLT